MERALIVVAAVIAAACAPSAPPTPPKAAVAPVPKTVATPAVSTAVAPSAPAPEPKTEKTDPNRELAKRVQRALEEENRIHAAAIDVTVKGGVVTLWGTAASADERQRASRVAYRVIGVTAVENKLAIASGS